MKRACRLHDQANLLLLPILGTLTAAGLFGYIDPVKITILFTWYIVADFTWILVEPDAVPSLPNVILLHHFVTFVLLCFPLRYPHLATYTCWDGICEINTFFLIARRQWKPLRQPFSILYWATFFPMRIMLYPYALYRFWDEMYYDGRYQLWEIGAVLGSQVMLICFNVLLLMLSAGNWRKRRGGGSPKRTEKSAPDIVEAQNEMTARKDRVVGNASVIKAQAATMQIKAE